MLKDHIPELSKITGMISGVFTGGGVNFAAMTARLEPSKDITAATIVADNLMMACYFFILIGISGSYAVRKNLGQPPIKTNWTKNGTSNQNMAADYWQTKPISLQSIALSLGASMAIVAVAFTVSKWLKGILVKAAIWQPYAV